MTATPDSERRALRLLHVVPTYYPAVRYGGPIVSVHALCKALAQRGHAVDVFTTNVDGHAVSAVPVATPVDVEGVRVTYFATGAGRRLYRSPGMARALAERIASYDAVHLHSVFLWPTLAAARAAARADVPYVVAPRGMLVGELIARKSALAKRLWIAAFERRTIAQAAAIHVTTQLEADEIGKLGLNPRRIAIVPNGVDAPPPDAVPRPRDAQGREGIVLSLGRLNWKKGLDRLIAAMALVPGAQLVIAGNDEDGYRATLEALAADAGIADRVRFLGEVRGRDKWAAFAGADVFAMPSYSENFGNAALEAMACGLPVVVTPEVGLASAIAQSGAGVVTPGEPQDLASAISSLLRDPSRRIAMGEAGRRAACEQFSWPAIAARMEAIYRVLPAGKQAMRGAALAA